MFAAGDRLSNFTILFAVYIYMNYLETSIAYEGESVGVVYRKDDFLFRRRKKCFHIQIIDLYFVKGNAVNCPDYFNT